MWLQQQNNLAETTSVYLSFLTVLRNYLIPARSEENTLTNYFYSPQKLGHCRWRQSRIVKHLSSGYKKGPGLETRELSEEGWSTPNPALCVCVWGGECCSTLRCPTNPALCECVCVGPHGDVLLTPVLGRGGKVGTDRQLIYTEMSYQP